MRLHLLGIPHTLTTKDFAHCAFTRFAFCVDSPAPDASHIPCNSFRHMAEGLCFQA